jgi:RimJ/RimL family protein N-acetyltransferase
MSRIDPQLHRLRSGHELVVRCPTVADAPHLCRYLEAIWADPGQFHVTGPGEVQLTPEREAAWIQAHLDAPAQLALVADIAGQIVGLLERDAPPRRRLAHTAELSISIAAGWREQGIGRLLIEASLAWARARPHLEKVRLTVIATNARAIHTESASVVIVYRLAQPRAFRACPAPHTMALARSMPVAYR